MTPAHVSDVDRQACTAQDSSAHRVATLVAVVVPFLGLLIGVYGLWGWGFSWTELGVLVVMYVATGLGITVGFHRLFTHRSFQTTGSIRVILAILGSMAVEGPLFRWVATHRKHHQHSDRVDDPHSPHFSGCGITGLLSGWWHAHVGWMFKPHGTGLQRYIGDFKRDRAMRRVNRLFGVWVALGLVIPAVAGFVLTGGVKGILLGFLWGGLVRVFLVHHVTWSINSVCHLWGTRPHDGDDESRNNALFGVLGFGEGWHNNHHAFPNSARYGMRWWQLDVGYWVIFLLSKVGLAWDVRVPDRMASSHQPGVV